MAGADYMHCDKCEKKAYYDSDVDYNNSYVWVLCEECFENFHVTITTQKIRYKC